MASSCWSRARAASSRAPRPHERGPRRRSPARQSPAGARDARVVRRTRAPRRIPRASPGPAARRGYWRRTVAAPGDTTPTTAVSRAGPRDSWEGTPSRRGSAIHDERPIRRDRDRFRSGNKRQPTGPHGVCELGDQRHRLVPLQRGGWPLQICNRGHADHRSVRLIPEATRAAPACAPKLGSPTMGLLDGPVSNSPLRNFRKSTLQSCVLRKFRNRL